MAKGSQRSSGFSTDTTRALTRDDVPLQFPVEYISANSMPTGLGGTNQRFPWQDPNHPANREAELIARFQHERSLQEADAASRMALEKTRGQQAALGSLFGVPSDQWDNYDQLLKAFGASLPAPNKPQTLHINKVQTPELQAAMVGGKGSAPNPQFKGEDFYNRLVSQPSLVRSMATPAGQEMVAAEYIRGANPQMEGSLIDDVLAKEKRLAKWGSDVPWFRRRVGGIGDFFAAPFFDPVSEKRKADEMKRLIEAMNRVRGQDFGSK